MNKETKVEGRLRRLSAAALLALALCASGCSLLGGDGPSDDDMEAMEQAEEQIQACEEEFLEDGYVPADRREDAAEAVGELAEELMDDGILSDYAVSGANVWLQYESGLQLVYVPRTAGTDSASLEASYEIVTCQPYRDDYPAELAEEMELPDAAAELLEQQSEEWEFRDNWDMERVSLNHLEDLGENQFILWHGHGGWTEETHSFLATGEEFDEDEYREGGSYYEDFQEGRLFKCTDGRVAVGADYFEEYLGSLDGSFVYLAACESGKDDTLAEAFLDKGAEAVVANSDTILTVYNTRMLYETVNGLCQREPDTGLYYSLEEALDRAASVWGASDAEQFGGMGARPEIFGGNHARAFCLEGAEAQPETDTPETAAPETTAPETQPAADAETVLQEYADSLTCLYGDGAIYTSYFVKEAGESGYPTIRYSFAGSFPLEPLGTLLLDFDRDGTQELLVVDVNPDYTLCLKMYEAVEGTAQCVSQCNLAATVVGQSESGYLDCVYYEQNGRTVIGFEERSVHRHIADGVLIRFTAVAYDGASLTVLGSPEYMGSDGMDYGFTEEMAALGIPVDFSEVFGGRSIFAYLPSPVVFSSSHTTCTWEMDEWLDFYMTWSRENTSETVEASVIEFR